MGGGGSFIGSLLGINKPKKPRMPAVSQAQKNLNARKKEIEDKLKKSAALKLTQIATGAGGILKEATTARKKLLGN